MGRYSSVQAYADSNANMRTVPYDQAVGSSGSNEAGGGAAKPEKVDNPYGSTAGAGSGEFHVYRHARAREMLRWKRLDEEERETILDQEYQEKLDTYQTEEDRKTAQRRKKRKRQKEAKSRKKNLLLAGVAASIDRKHEGEGGDEFTYVPERSDSSHEADSKSPSAIPFVNDGSFLEQMKKRLEEEPKLLEVANVPAGGDIEDDDAVEGPEPKKPVS